MLGRGRWLWVSGAGLEGLRGEKLTSGMGHMTNPVLGAGWASGKRLTEDAYSMRPRYFMNHAVAKKKSDIQRVRNRRIHAMQQSGVTAYSHSNDVLLPKSKGTN